MDPLYAMVTIMVACQHCENVPGCKEGTARTFKFVFVSSVPVFLRVLAFACLPRQTYLQEDRAGLCSMSKLPEHPMA